MRTLHFS